MDKKKDKVRNLIIAMSILYFIYCLIFIINGKQTLAIKNLLEQNIAIAQLWGWIKSIDSLLGTVRILYYFGGLILLLTLINEFKQKKIIMGRVYGNIIMAYACSSIVAVLLLLNPTRILTCLSPVIFSLVLIIPCTTIYYLFYLITEKNK